MSSQLTEECPVCSNGPPNENLTPEQLKQRKILHFNYEVFLRGEQGKLMEQLKDVNEAKHFNLKMIEDIEMMSRKYLGPRSRPNSPPPPPPPTK